MAVLEVRNLTTQFGGGPSALTVVKDVSFSVSEGEILGLVGESGSGKSVTGFSLMGLISPPGAVTGGSIRFDGTELRGLPEKQMRSLRGNRMGMIFQDPMSTLNPVLRIDTQMIETITAHEKVSRRAAWERARDALGMVGIPSPEERLKAYPHQFSGGMRQRVAIAIAMLHQPRLLIADEPTTALDVTIQAQILAMMQRLAKEQGMGLIWITHDLSVIAGFAESLAVMYAGRLVEGGPVSQILRAPQHPYTKGLIDSLPSSTQRGQPLRQIDGVTPSLARLPKGCAFHPRCPRTTEACLSEPPLLEGDVRSVRCFHPILQEGQK